MKNKMGFALRRVTGSTVMKAAAQKQEELHYIYIGVLALLMEEGLEAADIWFYDR